MVKNQWHKEVQNVGQVRLVTSSWDMKKVWFGTMYSPAWLHIGKFNVMSLMICWTCKFCQFSGGNYDDPRAPDRNPFAIIAGIRLILRQHIFYLHIKHWCLDIDMASINGLLRVVMVTGFANSSKCPSWWNFKGYVCELDLVHVLDHQSKPSLKLVRSKQQLPHLMEV